MAIAGFAPIRLAAVWWSVPGGLHEDAADLEQRGFLSHSLSSVRPVSLAMQEIQSVTADLGGCIGSQSVNVGGCFRRPVFARGKAFQAVRKRDFGKRTMG